MKSHRLTWNQLADNQFPHHSILYEPLQYLTIPPPLPDCSHRVGAVLQALGQVVEVPEISESTRRSQVSSTCWQEHSLGPVPRRNDTAPGSGRGDHEAEAPCRPTSRLRWPPQTLARGLDDPTLQRR